MMTSIKYNPVIFKMLLASAILLACASQSGHCQYEQERGYSIIIQVSPADAGFVTPEPGVHRIGLNETVLLTAFSKPGYRFLYWLGDVGDPTANETTTNLDSPKIIIAVFEREAFSLMTLSNSPQKGRGRGGGSATANRFRPKNGSSGGARGVFPPRPALPNKDPLPVPGVLFPVPGDSEGEGDEFPHDEPIPEPGSIALLGFGAVAALRRRRRSVH